MSDYVKVKFALEEEAPVEVEALWATPGKLGGYILDNIPMYVDGVSAEDEVSAEWMDDELWATGILKKGPCSTVRVEWIDCNEGEGVARDSIIEVANRLTSYGVDHTISPDEAVASLCLSRGSNLAALDDYLESLTVAGKVEVYNSDRDQRF